MSERRSISIKDWVTMTNAGCGFSVDIYINGESMRPLIRKGKDLVTIEPVTRCLKIGDVVLFTDGKRYVVHRIIRIMENGNRIETMGDNCVVPDRLLKKEQVLGLVTRYERNGKIHTLDSEKSRQFGIFWNKLLPFRKGYRRGRRYIGKIIRMLKIKA